MLDNSMRRHCLTSMVSWSDSRKIKHGCNHTVKMITSAGEYLYVMVPGGILAIAIPFIAIPNPFPGFSLARSLPIRYISYLGQPSRIINM